MAGFMKSAMSYLGMTDVAEGDEDCFDSCRDVRTARADQSQPVPRRKGEPYHHDSPEIL